MAERPLSSVSATDTLAKATHTPLPSDDNDSLLHEPRAPFLAPLASEATDSPRDSYRQQTPNDSGQLLAVKNEEDLVGEEPATSPPEKAKRRRLILLILIAFAILALLVIVIVVPVYFTVIKPRNNSSSSSVGTPGDDTTTDGPQPTSGPTAPTEPLSGGDGSEVKAFNGSTFTYVNQHGGIWYYDPEDPLNLSAYPNSWTPPLNKSWNYATDRMFGVNLGGWFVLEPFISPELFQRYPGARDEWDLSVRMAADTANGGLSQLEEHYKTFIVEQDIAEIASAGLNWVRLPIPFWAIETYPDEPYYAKVSWKYIVQALTWCRKYGIRVKLDLHTIPGSQSGYNHSGKLGQINFLSGTMGMANAQRAMNYIRIFTEFISQPEWKDVVPIFGIMNEARITDIGQSVLRGFYVELYKVLRGITGIGEGKGPYISLHDGFQSLEPWVGFLRGADRVAIDSHPYFAFRGGPALDPIDTGTGSSAGGRWPQAACNNWASGFNASRNNFGVTLAGEWSNGFNDCAMYLRGVGGSHDYGGDCNDWEVSDNWTAGTKAGLRRLAMHQMDAFRDWFFWTWKIGPARDGYVRSPLWSYQMGLRFGWMPTDPREALGSCAASGPRFRGEFAPWMTGGAGAGDIGAPETQYPYPPAALTNAPGPASRLPMYTLTGAVPTLTVPALDGEPSTAFGNGWANPNDNSPAPTPVPGCAYPNAYDAQNLGVPGGCTATYAPFPSITPPP